jgi:REP element-mobilizing transposase RayT
MILNDAGKMIEKEWLLLKQRFTAIELEAFIVMPNHFHAILNIVGETLVVAPNQTIDPIDNNKIKGQPQGIAPTNKTVGEIIGAYKSITTNQYIWGVKNKNWKRFDKKLWQRNYWEHIIQNERSYQNISRYIKSNPKNWQNDTLI